VEPKSEPEPEASVTVEELPQEEPAPQAEPTLEEVIDYINALTQAAATEPEAEPEPETSVTVEELPAETEPAPDGRGGSMPFVTSLAREMALLAAMGDMLGTANDPKGEITIEELFGE
jgi:pyruvate/2-oxoglutarate dehydrogenase complex dihydrolipoamide acyltransferase (E2) component